MHDSMTRWFVIHATQGVTLARNVGYLSIGHGYYLEDGTETNNSLYSNIGIFARAAVVGHDDAHLAVDQNPRKVPGILASPADRTPPNNGDNFPFFSDYDHPSVFWIMNGWNEFVGNMAAGAGTCGACYWLVPGWNSAYSGLSYDDYKAVSSGTSSCQTVAPMMHWDGYASLQQCPDPASTTPLKAFYGNYCTSAMNSFITVGNTALCQGVGAAAAPPGQPYLEPVNNVLAPADLRRNPPPGPSYLLSEETYNYYPHVDSGGGRFATQC